MERVRIASLLARVRVAIIVYKPGWVTHGSAPP